MSLLDVISEYQDASADFITDGDKSLSQLEFSESVQRCSKVLLEMGFEAGHRVLLRAKLNIDFIITYFGIQNIGACVVPIDIELKSHQEKELLDLCDTEHVIDPIGSNCYQNGMMVTFNEFRVQREIAFGGFSSGTTGTRKFMIVKHAQEREMAHHISRNIGNTHLDIELLVMPMSHSFGLGRMRSAVFSKTKIVIGYEFKNLKLFFNAIKEHGVTGLGLVPAALRYIIKLSGDKLGEYTEQLQYLELGSAQISIGEKNSLNNLLPSTNIFIHYGLTEVSRALFLNLKTDDVTATAKLGTGAQIKIQNENGSDCKNGVSGEIKLNAPWQAISFNKVRMDEKNYFDDSEYLSTGDIGYIKNDYLYFQMRAKEVINVGGRKISPLEIEGSVLEKYPDFDLAIVGAPNEILGESITCYFLENSTNDVEKLLKNFIEAQFPKYMHPSLYVRINQIPKTTSGKIQRFKLVDGE